jgi:hypothetical protein
LPTNQGGLGSDYAQFLPDLLTGYFWRLRNNFLVIPWFSPAQCGGVPFYTDPQIPYLSVPQFLAFLMPPVEAVQTSILLFAAIGFLGAAQLARNNLSMSRPASLLAGALFLFNNFYAARMLIGHLTFQPFMLTPALAIAIIPKPGTILSPRGHAAAAAIGGIVIAIMIQGGAIHVLPPALLSVAILAVIQAIPGAPITPPAIRLAAAVAIGCALSAGKLAAGFAFISNFPRNQYMLPGIPGLFTTAWRALQTLFLGPPSHPETIAVNSNWSLERHEWEYSVSIVPLALMLAWLCTRLVQPRNINRPAQWLALFLLLALPVVLNWYQPTWNEFLKSLPVLGNSSNLLRWFAAYILPACIGGALALDAIVRAPFRWPVAAAAALGVVATNALTDRSFYGPHGQGTYQVATIQAAWRTAAKAHAPPPITAIGLMFDKSGRVITPPNRQDALAYGLSQLLCYEPAFGYNLEHFPIGALHPGPALAISAGNLNVKNPACYVFPHANACTPGDPFPATRLADAKAFLDYRPFPFAKPFWARAADWLSTLTASALTLAAIAALRSRIVPKQAARTATAKIAAWAFATFRRAPAKHAAQRYPPPTLPPQPPRQADAEIPPPPIAEPPQPAPRPALIDIILPNNITVRIDTQFDPAALRRVLEILQSPA